MTMMKCSQITGSKKDQGFSLFELLVAMTITLAVMVGASTLLARSFEIRSRENRKSDGLADVQRALNTMTRELAISGYGLVDNGIVAGANDSNQTAIHFRANLNNTNSATTDADEDIGYIFRAADLAIYRYDRNTGTMTQLASRIDSLQITYRDLNGATLNVAASPQAVATATNLTLAVSVTLPATSKMPATAVAVVSEVSLRNAPGILSRF